MIEALDQYGQGLCFAKRAGEKFL